MNAAKAHVARRSPLGRLVTEGFVQEQQPNRFAMAHHRGEDSTLKCNCAAKILAYFSNGVNLLACGSEIRRAAAWVLLCQNSESVYPARVAKLADAQDLQKAR
jgi:hypothetical protein